jgi:hypothetical protein
MLRPTWPIWPSAARTDDMSLVEGAHGCRTVQQCEGHIVYITVTDSQVDPLLEWQSVGLICRTQLMVIAWSARLFELLVSTSSGAREFAAHARLDWTGRRERWGRYSECVRLDIPQVGVPVLPWKGMFRSPKVSTPAVGFASHPVQRVSGTPSWRRYRSAWMWRSVFIQYRE